MIRSNLIPKLELLFALAIIFSPRAVSARQERTLQPRVTLAVDESNRITFHGNTHPLARPEFDRGLAPDSQPMNRIMLLLQRSSEQETSLRQFLDNQQMKGSTRYHRWLTPTEFGQQFGPEDSDVQAVTSWLLSHGFSVNEVSTGKTIVEFSGNAGQIRTTFGTEMHRYVVDGREYWANASDPSVPVALAPVIAGFVSLNNFKTRPLWRGNPATDALGQDGKPAPLFTASSTYAVGPYDFATIYNSLPLLSAMPPINGAGQTIALAERSDICTAGSPDFSNPSACSYDDVQGFRSYFDLPTNLPGGGQSVVVIVNGPNPGTITPPPGEAEPNDEAEALLDVEVAGGVAPGAKIDVVVSQSTEVTAGQALSAEYIIDNNLAPVMSMSYLSCESDLGTAGSLYYDMLWEQAAAQGITVAISAGDSGSAGCDDKTALTASHGLGVNGIASTPFNTAVGGTDFNDKGDQSAYWTSSNNNVTKASALSYIPEVPWNNSCAATSTSTTSGCTPASANVAILAGGGGESECSYLSGLLGAPDPYCVKPPWQSGPVITGFETTDNVRNIPDLSLFASVGSASESAYVVCESDLNSQKVCPPFHFGGGTSASAPAFAGIMAMVNQYMLTQGDTGRQGIANYALYSLANQQFKAGTNCISSEVATGNDCTFYDVTTGNNSVPCSGGTPNCSNTTNGAIGVVVDDKGNLAWEAGAGYDLATGLGTINVTNLVHNWPAAVGTFAPTVTSFQVCAGAPQTCVTAGSATSLAISHGTQATVNITVSPVPPEAGTPTGAATLLGAPNSQLTDSLAVGDVFSLSGGTASAPTNYLVGGSYQIHAHYNGDGTFGASDSLPLNVTVSPETSITSLSLFTAPGTASPSSLGSGSTVSYGTPVLIHVTVAPTNSNQSSGTGATGLVNVTDSAVGFDGGSFALNNEGYTEVQTGIGTLPVLGVGSHAFQASYGGDSNYNSSQTSGTTPLTVTPAATSLSVTSSNSTALAGTPRLLTASLTTRSAGIAPTGTVTFSANATPISATPTYKKKSGFQPEIKQNGTTASLTATLSYIPTSTTTITASYSGDNNYASSSGTDNAQITVVPYFLSSPNNSLLTEVVIPAVGQTGTSPISVQLGTATTSLTLFCAISPAVSTAAPTCSFSPSNTVEANGTAELYFKTTAASSSSTNNLFHPNFRNISLACFLAALFAVAFFPALPARQRRCTLLFSLALVASAAMIACSTKTSGASESGTPSGVYTVTVYGSLSGAQPITVYFDVE